MILTVKVSNSIFVLKFQYTCGYYEGDPYSSDCTIKVKEGENVEEKICENCDGTFGSPRTGRMSYQHFNVEKKSFSQSESEEQEKKELEEKELKKKKKEEEREKKRKEREEKKKKEEEEKKKKEEEEEKKKKEEEEKKKKEEEEKQKIHIDDDFGDDVDDADETEEEEIKKTLEEEDEEKPTPEDDSKTSFDMKDFKTLYEEEMSKNKKLEKFCKKLKLLLVKNGISLPPMEE